MKLAKALNILEGDRRLIIIPVIDRLDRAKLFSVILLLWRSSSAR